MFSLPAPQRLLHTPLVFQNENRRNENISRYHKHAITEEQMQCESAWETVCQCSWLFRAIVWTRDGMIWVQPTGIRPFLSLQATWKKSALYVSQDCCKGISDPRIWGDTINHLYHLKCVRRSEIQLNPSKRRVSAVQLRRRSLLTWHETCLPQTRDIPELLSGLGQLCPSSTAQV